MNHKQFFTHGIMLVLVVLLTACATPTATPSPTVAAQAPPAPDAWTIGNQLIMIMSSLPLILEINVPCRSLVSRIQSDLRTKLW